MGNFFQHRRRTSLIVCMAILLNLLTPALGQAMSSLLRDPLALDICSATPAKRDQDMPHAGMKHCPFCATHATPTAPPPCAPARVVRLDGHDAYPSFDYLSPSPLAAWSGSRPRGPPALS
ncbi:hypothetical protein JOD97_002521 [Duganella sp. 1411]|uniref:DUF2946 family protein n=1 Tax=Duganella sp. 1411 TaxID=2806572 RepID=UPI001AEACEA4|nr:DUF2946 family protein [Duganella sp. 1411]MBP1204479.1 hypothetical protein [Duganella sp. 1411]